MHRLLPNDFHVVERTQEEQQPQQGPYDGEEGEIGQYQARQGQGQMIRQGQNGHGQQQRRIARRSLPSSHLTQYALRNCCRVFDAMEKSLGSNELLMDSMLHYMHYRNRRMNNVRSISVGKLYTMFKDGIVNWTNKYNTDGLKIIGEDILVHYTYPEVVAEEGGAVEGPDGSEYVKRKLYKAVRTTERNMDGQ